MNSKPNILFITTDMHRFDQVGCNGNADISTPNIDALASSGTRFTRAFANNPVCTPSRTSMLTGQVPSEHGARWNGVGMRPCEATVTRQLQDAGYETGLAGKMHWGDEGPDYGLDYANILDGDGVLIGKASTTYQDKLRSWFGDDVPDVRNNPEYEPSFGAVASPLELAQHEDSFVADATIEFLQSRDRKKPFFFWASFPGPHLPLDPIAPWDTMYDPAEIPLPVIDPLELENKPPEQRAFQQNTDRDTGLGDYRRVTGDPALLRRFLSHYWGKISMVDHLIGRITSALAELGDTNDTVIVFTSDHGDFAGHHGLMFKSAFMYDDLLHVPLIISAPGRWEPQTIDAFVEEIDLPRTFLSLASVEPTRPMQGDSLLPLLDGECESQKDVVYAEAVNQRMIRTADWKLVHYAGRPYGEVYNLAEDPEELVNLYDDPDSRPKRDELYHALVDHIMALEDRVHEPVTYVELADPESVEAGLGLRLPRL